MEVVRLRIPVAQQDNPFARALEHFTSALLLPLSLLFSGVGEAILVYSPPLPLACVTLFIAKVLDVRLIVAVRDLYPQIAVDMGLLKSPRAIWAFTAMERFVYRSAPRLTATSPANAAYMIARGARSDGVHVVYDWVDIDAIRPMPKMNSVRLRLGIADKFVASFAGLMSFPQDMATIVRAADELAGDDQIVFLLVGEGPRRQQAEELAKQLGLKNILFLPLVAKDEYAAILAASDVCLVTLSASMRTPVVPSKLQSILAAGRTPVVSVPSLSDARRIVEEGRCGIWVPPDNPRKFADAILRLRNNQLELAAFESRAREIALNSFSAGSAAVKIERLFLEP